MSKFTSNANKEFLWNLMYDGGIFNNINGDKLMDVKETFENNIYKVSKIQNKSLIELNKILMTDIINELSHLKNNVKYKTKRENKQDRENTFNNKLNELQNNFNSVSNVKIPNEIDFSDDSDKPLDSSDIDMLLEKTIENRKKQLNIVFDNSIDSKNMGDSKHNGDSWSSKLNNSKQILVGNNIEKKLNIENVPSKKVSFDDEIKTSSHDSNKQTYGEDLKDTFFSLLKKNNNKDDNTRRDTEIQRDDTDDIKNDIRVIKNELENIKEILSDIIKKM